MKLKALALGLISSIALVTAGVSAAKEIGSGGGGVVVVGGCSPIASLNAKGDAKVGETGLASIQLGWSVKPCDPAQPVRVVVSIVNWNTKVVVYSDADAELNSKITIYVPSRQTYQCIITVVDDFTGVVLDSGSVFTSTVPKGGV